MFGNGINLGTIFGFKFRIDYSWLIIFAVFTVFLAVMVFPSPSNWGDNMPETWVFWVMAVITILLFFVTVIIHELAHSFVARKYGIPVKGISLMLIGGSAEMTKEPDTPGVEFKISIAGPLSSLIIGAILIPLSFFLRNHAGIPFEALYPIYWLGMINVILGVFNLFPAFPLDGGRALRAIIWKATKSFDKATRICATIGRIGGVLIIAFGVGMAIWEIAGGEDISSALLTGVIFAMIGWMVYSGATSSVGQYAMQGALKGHTIAQALRPLREVDENTQLPEVIHMINSQGINALAVRDDNGHIVAAVEKESLQKLSLDKAQKMTVKDIAKPIHNDWIAPKTLDLLSAVQIFNHHDLNVLAVTDENGEITDILHIEDVVSYVNTIRHEIEARKERK